MTVATSESECVERHRTYHIDVWEASMNSLQTRRLRILSDLIPDNQFCLDVGCNSGYMAILKPSCRWWGIDIQEDLVEKAKTRMEKAVVGKVEDLPFSDKHFDSSCVAEVLEHVYDPHKVLYEASRVTKSLIVGSTPHERGAWGPNGEHKVETHAYHVRCFTEDTLRELLSSFGKSWIFPLFRSSVPQMYVFCVEVRDA